MEAYQGSFNLLNPTVNLRRLPGQIELEKTVKYGIITLTELPGANNTWDQAER